MGVQTLCLEATIEGLDAGVVGRLPQPAEVERHAFRIGSQIEVAGDELGALVDADRLRIADRRTDLLQCPDHVLGPVAESGIEHLHVAVNVSTTVSTRIFFPVAS